MLTTLPSLLPCALLQQNQTMHLLDQFQPNLEKCGPESKIEQLNITDGTESY